MGVPNYLLGKAIKIIIAQGWLENYVIAKFH